MNDQERQIISDIFTRLEGTAGQARDADAERFITDKVKAQPYAPYAMAQALYVQEEAMKSLNAQLEQQKAETEKLRQSAGSSGGFLSSIFGGGQRPAPSFTRPGPAPGYAPPQPGYAPQQQGGPWGGGGQPGYPQQGYAQQGQPWGGQQQAGGGGFLRSAMTTAAGVAGGMVVGNALMNAFSGSHHSTLGSLSNTDMASMGFPDGGFSGGGAGYQDASFGDGGGAFSDGGGASQDASFSDGGGVFSDGGGAQDAGFDSGGVDFGGGGGGNDDSWT